jgi:CRISPR-associated protein Csm4
MPFVNLAPKGPFHIGEHVGIERQRVVAHIPSDTIFSAMFAAWAALGLLDEVLAYPWESQPPLLLTSAFPCLVDPAQKGADRIVLRFYPRPMVALRANRDALDALEKGPAHAEWVSETLFRAMCAGEDISDACHDRYLTSFAWFHPHDLDRLPRGLRAAVEAGATFWDRDTVPRVSLDRLTNMSNLYHVGRMVFGPEARLWFSVRLLEPAFRDHVVEALNFLADAGLGGLRSTGMGGFAWSWGESEDAPSPAAGYAVTLSRYAPRDADEVSVALQSRHSAYRVVKVGGWCHDDSGRAWRRRQIRLVSEGSVVGVVAGRLQGKMATVTPIRPPDWDDAIRPWPFGERRQVYRWGYAYLWGIGANALQD